MRPRGLPGKKHRWEPGGCPLTELVVGGGDIYLKAAA